MASSMPISAVAGRPDVMDMHPAGSMTSTHTGNPICCAAALASIDLVVGEDLAGNARRMGAVLHEGLRALQSRFPQIGSVDGKGLVAGVACVAPGTRSPDGELAWQVVQRCVEKGLLLFSPVGFGGGTVKISPPLVIHEAAIRESVGVLGEAFDEITRQRAAAA
jgi:4-aminobutyrate aminotransferase/diaminobutyrate-pyruvate transaminase/4-aminobutyrate aminotransferase/(S)-3-amino-2-methylpropionate transaminase